MVENEIYYQGWEARLDRASGLAWVQAFPVDGLRAWRLPPGSYRMTARFRHPNRFLLGTISVSSLVLWLVALVSSRRWAHRLDAQLARASS
jgi:hypothetical protein